MMSHGMPSGGPKVGASQRDGAWLTLGILHEAVESFSRQDCLDDFWPCVCKNARWIVPAHRMCVLLLDGDGACTIAGQMEAGRMLVPPAGGLSLGDDAVGDALRGRGVQWHTELRSRPSESDPLRAWLLKDCPAALLSVPIRVERAPVGALVFVLRDFDAADQSMLSGIVTGFALYVGMTYALLNTLGALKGTQRDLQASLVAIEGKNAELERTTAEIHAKNMELEKQNAELERFTYTVSHDLKTPLVTIKGFLGLLRQDIAAENAQKVTHDIAQIDRAAETMGRLLSDLLELSRIGRVLHPHEELSLSDVAREAVELLHGTISGSTARVLVHDGMPIVRGDRIRLLEVYQNLIENAVKFMGDQSAPEVEVGASVAEGGVLCFVRDNGIGIEPEYRERVFGLFDRLDDRIEGTGVGLALAKRIVDMHGGRIWIESPLEGPGCTFFFTLPDSD